MSRKKKLLYAILLIGVGLGLTIGALLLPRAPPMEEALTALASTEEVNVEVAGWYTFTSTNQSPTTALIFYPGGNVAPEAYAPLAQQLAQAGIMVVIVPMPFDLAVFAPARAAEIIEAYPEISSWIIGGHSLGGAMAAEFVANNPELLTGLILLASYPAASTDLSGFNITCLSIYGTLDGVVSEDIPSTINRLPQNTTLVAINGGNHAYFGYYGEQAGDNPATITREEQHQQTVTAIIAFMASI